MRFSNIFHLFAVVIMTAFSFASFAGCAAHVEDEVQDEEFLEVDTEDYVATYQACESGVIAGLWGLRYIGGSLYNYGRPPAASECAGWCASCGKPSSHLAIHSNQPSLSFFQCSCW